MGEELYKIELREDVTIVTLALGDFLHDVNDQLMKGFDSIFSQGHKNIVLDLKDTNYMSSLILASLVFIQKLSQEKGGNLVLCNIRARVQEILIMTNLDKVFNIASSLEDAVAFFKKK